MVVKKQVKWLKEKKENPPTNVIIYLQLIKKNCIYIEGIAAIVPLLI